MKVLHVQKVKGIGGSERHLLALLPALASNGIEVRMCVMAAGDADRFVSQLRPKGIDTVVLPAGPHLNPRLIRPLVAEIKRFSPAIVHTHLVHADLYGQVAARALGAPTVSSVHGANPRFGHEPLHTGARAVGRLPKRTIAISEHVRRFLERLRLRDPASIRVVPYGIEAAEWASADALRATVRADLGLEPEAVAVGIAARLIPGKGHDLLLDAFAAAHERARQLRLAIAGDGPLRGRLEEQARRLAPGVVHFAGFVPDMRRFMAACDVLAFPTRPDVGEGFGLAALEAMAAARAVVATAVGALPEVVEDGTTGLVVPADDPRALADALVALADDPARRRHFGEEGRRRAETVFPLEAMVRRTLAVYGEVV